jgi:hypothetical protein
MSITNVHLAINRHLRDLVVEIPQSESYVDGELVVVSITGVNKELAIFPLSRRDLEFLPEGEYTFQDKKIYEIGSGTVEDKSIVTFDNSKYLVDGGTRRNFEGGFTTYIAKRISDSE